MSSALFGYSMFFAVCKEISEKSKREHMECSPTDARAGDTDPYTTPARRQPSGGFMIDIGFYINALYNVVSTSPSSMAVVEMTTKPSAVMVIALPAAAIAWAGMT